MNLNLGKDCVSSTVDPLNDISETQKWYIVGRVGQCSHASKLTTPSHNFRFLQAANFKISLFLHMFIYDTKRIKPKTLEK